MAKIVAGIKYPPLAAQARIQGEVHLSLGPDGIHVILGHPLFVPAATESFKGLVEISSEAAKAIYHFTLTEPVIATKPVIVKKGNAIDRLILRVRRLKTERTVTYCVEGPPKDQNRIDTSKRPLEIWVYGVAPHCLQEEATQLAASPAPVKLIQRRE